MGASRNKPKRCETCAFYKPGDMKGQGWCMHPKRQQSGGILLLVRARALDCRNSWGEDFWTPGEALEPAPSTGAAAAAASDAPSAHAPAADDLVIQHTSSTRNDGAAMTNTTKSKHDRDDDESINHAALSDQEDRAHVMARGAREAILRARERKKERMSSVRQPRVAAMPAADMGAGDWSDFDDTADAVTDDTVLGVRHQPATDPFRRSYDDPAPPVPSRELPAEARGMVSSGHGDRFDTVPEYREDIELPRPAHLANDAHRHRAGDDSADDLPDNPALTSYDRVLQRARRFQRLSTARGPQRVIRHPAVDTASSTVTESLGREPDERPMVHDVPTVDQRDAEPEQTPTRHAWQDEPVADLQQPADVFEDFEGEPPLDDAGPEQSWDEDDDPFPEDDDAPWLAAESMTLAFRPRQSRPRFRMPQLSFWRQAHHENAHPDAEKLRWASDDGFDDDEVVAHSAWTADEQGAAVPEPEDDPDWADDAVPVETYVAAQPASVPADVAPSGHDTVAWDDSWADDDWVEDEDLGETAIEEDFVTAEATVPHRPQPAPATFDMANLRARLFARRESTSGHQRHEPMPTAGARREAINASPPDDDPDPDPGSGAAFEPPAQWRDDRWSEPVAEPEFDLREVVRRQGELLDMRIQIAPEVPRECRTCRNFRPAEGGERGWCTNEWAFSHRRMVNADDLPCESSIGCWWLPTDDTWMPHDDLAALTQPTPLVDRLLGRLGHFRDDEEEEPLRARAR